MNVIVSRQPLYKMQKAGLHTVKALGSGKHFRDMPPEPWLPTWCSSIISGFSSSGLYKGSKEICFRSCRVMSRAGNHISSQSEKVPPLFSEASLVSRVYNTIYPINPVNGKRHLHMIPHRLQHYLGELTFHAVTRGYSRYYDAQLQNDYSTIINRLKNVDADLFAESQWRTYQIDVVLSDRANAFATPGGHMAIYSGLDHQLSRLKDTIQEASIHLSPLGHHSLSLHLGQLPLDDLRAAVVAHEMSHVAACHGEKRIVFEAMLYLLKSGLLYLWELFLDYVFERKRASIHQSDAQPCKEVLMNAASDIATNLFSMSYSRSAEFEADLTSVHLLKKAGYNPLAALWVQEMFDRQRLGLEWPIFNYFSSHPTSMQRKQAIFGAILAMEDSGQYIPADIDKVFSVSGMLSHEESESLEEQENGAVIAESAFDMLKEPSAAT